MLDEPSTDIDWEAALVQHRPWLRKVMRCRIGDGHEVDDLLQEIALAVFRQSNREDSVLPKDPEKVAPWLYRLAVRQSINFHRRAGRKSAAQPVADLDSYDTNSEPLDWMLAEEERGAMQDALNRLRSQDREILTLKYTENWNYRQLAQHLGVKERTVEYRLMRARQNLRNLLSASVPQTVDTRPK